MARFFAKDTVEAPARETTFVQRESNRTGHLVRITDTWAMRRSAHPTLAQLPALRDHGVDSFDEEIRRVRLPQRINPDAVPFFEAIRAQARRIPVPLAPTWQRLTPVGAVRIVERRSWPVPATRAHRFRGSGGHRSAAAIPIRFGADLKAGRLCSTIQEGIRPAPQTGHGVEEEVHAGSLRITDLGFFTRPGFAALDAKRCSRR
jgi:hypothetical protein